MPLVVCQPCFRRWWLVSQRGVRSDGVVVSSPAHALPTSRYVSDDDDCPHALVRELEVLVHKIDQLDLMANIAEKGLRAALAQRGKPVSADPAVST